MARLDDLTAFVESNEGERYIDVREDADLLDWRDYFPVVDAYGCLTGEIVGVGQAGYELVSIDDKGTVIVDIFGSDAVVDEDTASYLATLDEDDDADLEI